jgi:hypothetical protein
MTSTKFAFLKTLGLFIGLGTIAGLVACGGGGSTVVVGNPPTISLATTPSPTPASLAVGGTITVTATITNDTSGANWSATCGSTTAGACGTFSSANTASGTAVTYTAPATPPPSTVTITGTVADASTISASTSAITITGVPAITVTLTTPPPASLLVSGTATIAATVANDSVNAGVTYAVTCGSAGACGSFNPSGAGSAASAIYTAPAAVPSGNTVTITATSVTDTTATASATVVITNPPTALNSGTYVFSVNGADLNGFYSLAGAFTIGANNTISGEQDFTDVNPATGLWEGFLDTFSGTIAYSSGSDSNAIITITTSDTAVGVNGTETFTATLLSAQRALITEFDSNTTSSGTLAFQNSPVTPSGSFAFYLEGLDPIGLSQYFPTDIGGILTFDGAGNLTTSSSVLDVNDPSFFNIDYIGQTFSSGTVSLTPDSFGRVTISLTPSANIPQIGLIGYMEGSSSIRLVESASDSYGGVTGGIALGETSTITNASLSGASYVLGMDGSDTTFSLQVAGVLTFTATPGSLTAGTVSGTLNYNDGAVQNAAGGTAFSGTYTLDTTDPGRVSIANFTDGVSYSFNLELYLTGDGHAVVISVDAGDGLAGSGFQQSGSFSAATLSGSYGLNLRQVTSGGLEYDGVGPVTFDGISAIAGYVDLNEGGIPSADVPLIGTFAANSTGIFTGTITGIDSASASVANSFTLYVGDSTNVIGIETDVSPDQLTLGYFQVQQ